MIDVPSAHRRVPPPQNDPNRSYAPGTPERAELKSRLRSKLADLGFEQEKHEFLAE